jgi:hypothetical protein
MKKDRYTLPNHLNDKILKGVSFINKDEPKEIIKARLDFLEKEKNYTKKEISYILLLSALPMVDEFFSNPENIELASKFNFDKVDNRTIN